MTPLDTAPPSPLPRRAAPLGVLLANLGTPDAPTAPAVRAYLREFLTDRKVVDLAPAVWRPLLELVILPRRSPRVARAYASIWTDAGSPLGATTAETTRLLSERLGDGVLVRTVMRYGRPALGPAVDELTRAGCERIVLLPLFPQWSDTTSGTLQAAVADALAARTDAPALTVVPGYPDDPLYVDALARRVEEALAGREVDRTLLSFHGLPERYVQNGDPYLRQCQRTAVALAERLALPRDRWDLVFQSRFGREPWLQPYLDRTLERCGAAGERIAVVLPGFAADCLETLEEVAVEGRRLFEAAGGRELCVVPALNTSARWLDALEALVRRHAGLLP